MGAPLDADRPMPDHNTWPVFLITGDDGSPGPTDLSYLLEKPAGAAGFVRIVEGHLVNGDGRRLRLWGQNITAQACLPSMQHAPVLARHLAKYGINCVRLHFMDLRWPVGLLLRSLKPKAMQVTEDILIGNHAETTRSLDPEALARLDFFVACCKENGVYVDLNLNVARQFTEADGVPQAEWMGFAKGLTFFVPRLIELQKEYAAQLLGHTNPFTGNRYAEEPAVALVELINENSLLESWLTGRLRGEQVRPGSTWSDIPPVYAAELDRRWNFWLEQKYGGRQALVAAWNGDLREDEDPARGTVRRLRKEEFPRTATERFTHESTFYAEIEQAWFEDMAAYLRNHIGVRQIILGSSDHNQGTNNPLHLRNLASLGITDGHYYWQHPQFPPELGWSMKHWSIPNTPMMDDPDRCVIARVSRSKVKGLPYLVSETNLPFPNDFASGFIPILAAYGQFQDWDGIFLYSYLDLNSSQREEKGVINSFFAIANDPVKMGEAVAAGLAFLRGDVQSARQSVERNLTLKTLVESQLMPLKEAPYLVPHLPGRLALTHQVSIASFNAEGSAPKAGEVPLESVNITSDTGELRWRAAEGDGRVCVDTPCWQAVIGRAGDMATENISVHLASPYATIQGISLDGEPIRKAAKILLVTTARVANTDMAWQDSSRRSLGEHFGHAPTRIEPVAGVLTLCHLREARQVSAQTLDGSGQPVGNPQLFEPSPDGWQIQLDGILPGVWHLVQIER